MRNNFIGSVCIFSRFFIQQEKLILGSQEKSGGQGIDPDIHFGEMNRQPPGKIINGRFRSRVGRDFCQRSLGTHRGDVQDNTAQRLKQVGYSRIKSKGVKQAPFYVLLGAQMPAILVETSFISNPRECQRLVNPKYQDRLAEGIVRGVRKYIRETSPTALQERRPQSGKQG